MPAKEWNYYFHADFEFENLSHFEKSISKIQPLTEDLKVLGIYQKGNTH
jgi:prephenate dehydratase